MMKKLITTIVVAVATVGVLTGCAVSSDERAICEAEGGSVTSERFTYAGKPGSLWASNTGSLHYCETSRGTIGTVYNKAINEVGDGFFSASNKNKAVFEECTARGGNTYRTSKSNGKTSSTRYACVIDGVYVQILN